MRRPCAWGFTPKLRGPLPRAEVCLRSSIRCPSIPPLPAIRPVSKYLRPNSPTRPPARLVHFRTPASPPRYIQFGLSWFVVGFFLVPHAPPLRVGIYTQLGGPQLLAIALRLVST